MLVLARESLEPVEPAAQGKTMRPARHGAALVQAEAEDYDEAREGWTDSTGAGGRDVLGQIGGRAAWIQGEETPSCDTCGASMDFVAQLGEGPDADTALNFGGGCAYVYRCRCAARWARMLWQR